MDRSDGWWMDMENRRCMWVLKQTYPLLMANKLLVERLIELEGKFSMLAGMVNGLNREMGNLGL